MGTLLSILVPFAVLALVTAVVLGVKAHREGPIAGAPRRPWWGSPAVWGLVAAAFVLLGLFVAPRLLGFTFLFLPFLWIRGAGRGRRPDGRRPEG